MRQISGIKRLMLGLGVMAIGVVGALPFRHATGPEPTGNDQVTWNPVTLGDDVSLQVPGQSAVVKSVTPRLQPTPSDEELQKPKVDTVPATTAQKRLPPPELADSYRPLFRPDSARQASAGHVIGSEVKRKPPKKHRIRDGDTLESLADRYLGDRSRADEILLANRETLTDPELLPIGVQILIPRSADVPSDGSTDGTENLVPLPPVDFR